MKKIISLFKRNYGDGPRLVYDEVVPGAEWVLAGDGIATRKWDGTCTRVHDGTLWKRFDAKHGKTPPAGFVAAQDPDPETGHWPGWLAIGDGPEDRWHRDAIEQLCQRGEWPLRDGTYALIGPKIQGNPERVDTHRLIRHGDQALPFAPRTFDFLRSYFTERHALGADIEGIVWHHPDGRMVKIKSSDFGIPRAKKASQ